MKLNEHFSSEEFECKCGCGLYIHNEKLLTILTEAREYFGAPLRVLSGLRCEEHNRKVGGAVKSQHLLGTAADISVVGVSPWVVANYIEKTAKPGGLGRYDTFTHVDVREGRARWGG